MKCPWPACNGSGTLDFGTNRKPKPCPACAYAERLARAAICTAMQLTILRYATLLAARLSRVDSDLSSEMIDQTTSESLRVARARLEREP